MHANFIAGRWVEGPDASDNIDPSDVSDVIGEYTPTDLSQTEQAISTATVHACPSP